MPNFDGHEPKSRPAGAVDDDFDFDLGEPPAAAPARNTSVPTAAAENFSQYTAGGGSAGSNVKTNYTKVRIDPATLKIDTNDKRYATSVGALTHGGMPVTSMPYATAMGCVNNSANGLANIDLTGTQFAIATGALVASNALGMTTPTPNGQVRAVSMTGGGNCGWNAPSGAFNPFNNSGSPLSLVYFP